MPNGLVKKIAAMIIVPVSLLLLAWLTWTTKIGTGNLTEITTGYFTK